MIKKLIPALILVALPAALVSAEGFVVPGPKVPPFIGAVAELSADVTGVNASGGANVDWDAEETDTHAFHDNSTNALRLTVPAEFDQYWVQVGASLGFSLVAADNYIIFQVTHQGSGGAENIWRQVNEVGATSPAISYMSRPVQVSAGDYFFVRITTESDTSITLTKQINSVDSSNFWIRVVGRP